MLDQAEAVAAEPLKQLGLFSSVVALLRSSLAGDALASLFEDVLAKIIERDDPETMGSTVIDAIEEVIQSEKDTKDRQKEQFDPTVLDRALALLKDLAVSSTQSTIS